MIIYFNTHVQYVVLAPKIDASLLSAHFATVYLNNKLFMNKPTTYSTITSKYSLFSFKTGFVLKAGLKLINEKKFLLELLLKISMKKSKNGKKICDYCNYVGQIVLLFFRQLCERQ